MTKTLRLPDDEPRRLAPTTTKLAKRMLAASRVHAELLPDGFYSSPALDTLLTLYVAEEDACYPGLNDLAVAGSRSPFVVRRWVDALAAQDLVERRNGLLALTDRGHAALRKLLEAVLAAESALD